jgi:ATP-dependent helicase/nuclease subunit A
VSGTGVPADAAARRAALGPAGSFLVEAPAGSGKTTLLIQRFLTLLAAVERPEALLAITFTRMAAAEMREKIVAALAGAAAGAAPRNAADALTLELARAVLATDARRHWELQRQPGRLRIQTIDALNHWLAGRLPVLSRAGASLEVAERPEELYLRAARRTIAELEAGGELAAQLALVLEHLDNEVDKLEPLLAGMLASRAEWLRHVLPGSDPGEPALRGALEGALAALVGESLVRVAGAIPPAEAAGLFSLARSAAARHPEPDAGLRRLAALGPGAQLAPQPQELEGWQALASLLLTQKGEFRKLIGRSLGFPAEAARDKQEFKALLERLGAVPGLEAALAALPGLPPPRYDEGQWRVLLALRAVLLAAAARLGEEFAAAGAVDHPAVQQAALEALGAPEEPSDLTLELDYRIQHILVDEFQDTSAAQVTLLERLTSGWQAGDGRTLFLVGDPMQSIYGFRDTNVGLFLQVKRFGLGSLQLEPLRLTANFRSQPALVDWFNSVFARVLPAREDLARGAVPFAASEAMQPAAAEAPVTIALVADGAEEGRCAAELIARERARDPDAAIVVLGRTRSALGPVAHALAAQRIPYQGVKLVPLAERPAVRDLIALTRALTHQGDRIAWLACLRAPWCGLELECLHALAGDSDAPLAGLLHEPERLARLPPARRARLTATRDVLDAALGERGRRGLAATVEAAWLALGGPATLEDAVDLDNAEAFFAELATLERGADLDDPLRLEDALGKLFAAPGPEAKLQLMTVHAAKGLEWDVVVLVGLGRGVRASEPALLRWLEFARADAELGLVLAPHRAGALDSEPLEAWLKSLEREREDLELGRLAYVAATRAKRRLLLVGRGAEPGRRPRKGTLLATLWPALADAVPRPAAATAPAAGRAPARLTRLVDGWRPPPPAAALVALADPPPRTGPAEFEFEWVGAAARHVGTVVHEELERAAQGAQARRAAPERRWRRRLAELGVPEAELGRALERVARALAATWADARGQWLFDPGHREAASELELSGVSGGRPVAARIDRTFVAADGVRWIVDFKTSVHEGTDVDAFLDRERERYAAQLEAYATLIRAREPARPIRLGLYFPMLGGWREWQARPG